MVYRSVKANLVHLKGYVLHPLGRVLHSTAVEDLVNYKYHLFIYLFFSSLEVGRRG